MIAPTRIPRNCASQPFTGDLRPTLGFARSRGSDGQTLGITPSDSVRELRLSTRRDSVKRPAAAMPGATGHVFLSASVPTMRRSLSPGHGALLAAAFGIKLAYLGPDALEFVEAKLVDVRQVALFGHALPLPSSSRAPSKCWPSRRRPVVDRAR